MIYLLFKPLDIKQQEFIDVPQFEILDFVLYELDNSSLSTVMKGSSATRFSDRYVVKQIDYTDNSREYISNMKANNGIYKNDIVDLEGEVFYVREDGLIFESQEATYNKKTNITSTKKDFVIYRDNDKVTGTRLKYNNALNRSSAQEVRAKYQLQEEKQ